MTLLQTKAVDCQLLAVLVLGLGLAVSITSNAQSLNVPPQKMSIIPRASMTPLRPKLNPAKPSQSLSKPKKLFTTCSQWLTLKIAAKVASPKASITIKSVRATIAPTSPSIAKAQPAPDVAAQPATSVLNVEPSTTISLGTLELLLKETDQIRAALEEASEKRVEDKNKFELKAKEYTEALKSYLDSKSILYTEFKSQIIVSPEMTLTYPILVLSTEGSHRLNRFSAGMKRRYDSKLIIDFIFNRREGGFANYIEKAKALFMSEDSLKWERVTQDEIEEILHVQFAAERNERDKSIGHVPVQMFFVSSQEVSPEVGFEHDYVTEMTFEDIWAQAVKISINANQVKDQVSDENLEIIQNMATYLAGMTQTAELAVDKAKLSLLESAPSLNKRRDGSAYFILGYEGEFNFGTFIPQAAIENAGDYAIQEMNASLKLIRFMREYFFEPASTQKPSREETFAKAVNFRGALYEFIAQMGRSKPTAAANYDMIAQMRFHFEHFEKGEDQN